MFKAWDFRTNVAKYEVKTDRLAYKYGGCRTMFIEFECSGNPSGINATEADYYIYIMVKPNDEYEMFRIPVADLKTACDGCEIKKGGDGYRARGYIVPIIEKFRMTPSIVQRDARTQNPPALPKLILPVRTPPSGNTSPSPS